MAKISLEYDTVDKTLIAKQDGKKVEFSSLSFVGSYDDKTKYNMEMYHSEKDEENDMWHSYRCMCKKYDDQKINEKFQEYFNKQNKV